MLILTLEPKILLNESRIESATRKLLTEELLNLYKKDQLLEVANHYGVELHKQSKKDVILATLKAHLVEEMVLTALAVGASPSVDMIGFSDVSPGVRESSKLANVAPILTGLGAGLTFEQQNSFFCYSSSRSKIMLWSWKRMSTGCSPSQS